MWRASGRIHYSNPWTRALLWTNCHLDVQWAVRLVGAVLKRASKEPVLWALMRGTAPAALNARLIARGWLLAGPWRWSHPFAGLRLDLTAGRGPMTQKVLKDRIGRQQHCLRQGWRAWAATQWVACDRHELRTFDLWQAGGQGLRNLNWPDTQAWANSSAAAATVASGACFSPATWHVASIDCREGPRGPRDHLCIWGCGALGTLDHLRWTCPHRPRILPKPGNPLTARFGWRVEGGPQDLRRLREVREWLTFVQLQMWEGRFR